MAFYSEGPLTGMETLLVLGQNPVGTMGVKATGTYTFTANPTNGQNIVLNGVTWTFVTAGATGNQTNIGIDLAATLAALSTNLNASPNPSLSPAEFSVTGSVLNIEYSPAGTAGNAFTLTAGTYGGTVSGATLTGGTNGTNGVPAATEFLTTTQAIADLSGGTGAGGGGNVIGPLSAGADGNVVLFDGTTGKIIKDSGVPLLMFKTIAVAGQGNVVADSSTDTLTLVAGTNMTITTVAGTDTITFDAAGGGGGAPGPYLVRNDATALSAATILANTAAGNNRYVLTSITGVPITLPFPTGTGTVLEFLIDLKATSNGYVFDTGVGGAGINPFKSALSGRASLTAGGVSSVNNTAAGSHNRMTLLNGFAGTGGDVNDVIYITDAIAGQYQVSGLITVDTTTATFSAY